MTSFSGSGLPSSAVTRPIFPAGTTVASWIREVPDTPLRYISVNVSALQFRTPGFVDHVRRIVTESGVRPGLLLLEITESLLLKDDESVWADLAALRETGIRIAIDDFGTGYSSLSYLRHMSIDVLKIDKSFIDEILHSTQQRALVAAIIRLAETLELSVIAEGIEDPAHREMLAEMGCPYGQGYLFSKPVGSADIMHWLQPRGAAEPSAVGKIGPKAPGAAELRSLGNAGSRAPGNAGSRAPGNAGSRAPGKAYSRAPGKAELRPLGKAELTPREPRGVPEPVPATTARPVTTRPATGRLSPTQPTSTGP